MFSGTLDMSSFKPQKRYIKYEISFSTLPSEEPESSRGTEDPATTPTPTRSDPSERCQPLYEDPICKAMPYNAVIYPNILGHRNQSQALVDLHKYSVFMSMQDWCPDELRTFLCVAYRPPCKVLNHLPPYGLQVESIIDKPCGS